MNTILITDSDKEKLYRHLLQNPNQENMAITYCGYNKSKEKLQFIVRDMLLLNGTDLTTHTKTGLEIKEEVYKQILLRAEASELSMLVWHSHPFSKNAWFSSVDNANDLEHGKFIKKYLPRSFYGNVIISQEGFEARLFNNEKESFERIKVIETFGKPEAKESEIDFLELDRNYRAFGKQGQSIISTLRVALVGCGGLGWHISQQLIALGVRNLLLIDPDRLEKTNLNRLPGAPYSKIGKPKVQILSGLLKKMHPEVRVNYRVKNVHDRKILNELKNYDIIIGAVDSENVRLTLNNFAVKYLKYYIDSGTEIIVEDGEVKHAGGQINTVIPGITPCLVCNHLLDWKMISYENLNSEERKIEVERGYIRGISEPSASVVSINGVVASALVNEFMALATSFTDPNPYLFFDFMNKEKLMFPISVERNKDCVVCSKDGLLGYGDIEKQMQKKTIPSFLNLED